MKNLILIVFFIFTAYAQDEFGQGHMEILNPNLEAPKDAKDLKIKHVNDQKQSKFINVDFRNSLIKEFKLSKVFADNKFDELDKDNFFRRVEYYPESKILEFYPFAKDLKIDHIKNMIQEYRNE